MDVKVAQGAIQKSTADTIIVNLFEGVTEPGGATGAVDQALDGALMDLIAQGDITGKAGKVGVFYPRGTIPAKRVLVAGLGPSETFDLEGVRRAAAAAIEKARALNAQDIATVVHGGGVAGLPAAAAAQAVVAGSALALYEYDPAAHENFEGRLTSMVGPLFSDEEAETPLRLTLVEFDERKIEALKEGVTLGTIIAQGVGLARDLVNMPPNIATPEKLAQTAVSISKRFGMWAEIGDRRWIENEHMGAFLAVAQGAGNEPRFIILEHNRDRADELDTLVLVGKGITFDTGGISLKSRKGMETMKSDMAGAAAVLGTLHVVGARKLPLHVVGLLPCTENKPDAEACRPSDVVTAGNGKTIEIISTDAEGRMLLADALVFAQRYDPDAVVDLATLTGSSVIALGEGMAAALFTNMERLRERLIAAGDATRERVWPMPLWDEYTERIKSDVADLKNSGGRYGGLGTSAAFLQAFTTYPWAHVDIAGTAYSRTAAPYTPKGATGYGVRLLSAFLHSWLD